MIRILIGQQCLIHRNRYGVKRCYPISTAAKGIGNQRNSWQTPLGRHRIFRKIGDGMPINTVFRGRKACGVYREGVDNPDRDWILTRILWLEGMQTGVNRRGKVDTRQRYIYIHGTHDEARLGTPASHGCIRMKNTDIIQLFDACELGESVVISR